MNEQERGRQEQFSEQVTNLLEDPSKPWNVMMDSIGTMTLTSAVEEVVAAGSDVAVLRVDRSNYGREGGLGKFKQIFVIYKGSFKNSDGFEYRNRYRAGLDCPENADLKIDNVSVTQDNKKIRVAVTLVSRRSATYKREFVCEFEES